MTMIYPPRFMDKVKSIILEHLSKDAFNIQELSDALALSQSQVYRKIKSKTDLTPSLYIRKIRLEKAHDLIAHSDEHLSIIAYHVGFSSLAYFSRCFSKEYGYAPSSLRKEDLVSN